MLLPDSWAVHLWDMAIRWLAVYYFITARTHRRSVASRRVYTRHTAIQELFGTPQCWHNHHVLFHALALWHAR